MTLRDNGRAIVMAAVNEYSDRRDNPNLPYRAEEIAADVLACAEAGAAIVHVHSRLDDGRPALPGTEIYRRVMELVAEESDVLVTPTDPRLGDDVTAATELVHVWALDDEPPGRGRILVAPFDLWRKGPPPFWDAAHGRLLRRDAAVATFPEDRFQPPEALAEIVRRGLVPMYVCFDLDDVRWTSHVVLAGHAPQPALVCVEFFGRFLNSASPTPANLDRALDEWVPDVDAEFVVMAQMVDDRDDYERLLLHGLARGAGLRVGIGDAPDLYPTATNADLVRWAVDRLADHGLEPALPSEVVERFTGTPRGSTGPGVGEGL